MILNSNGNLNNNNRYNNNRTRAVAEFDSNTPLSREDVWLAYYDCRKNIRNTESQLEFEVNYEFECLNLWREIVSRTYRPGESTAFIVEVPCKREVFAASFRDRVVQHLISLRLVPILESVFISNSFNNRVGKGTLFGAKTLASDIQRVSNNYTEDCYVAILDHSGFFMSIHKPTLCDLVDDLWDEYYHEPDKDLIKWLTRTVLEDCPEKHCRRNSKQSRWEGLAPNKSLFTCGEDKGLPIGNNLSQLLANYILNDFDHYVLDELQPDAYGRYVDDFYVVCRDKSRLLAMVPKIREKLASRGLILHPRKFYCQHYSKGVKFVGSVVKKNRFYLSNRTVNNAFHTLRSLNLEIPEPMDLLWLEKFQCRINSYLGFMRHHDAYNIRRRFLKEIDERLREYVYVGGDCERLVIRKKYRRREVMRKTIASKKKLVKIEPRKAQ